MQQLLYIVLCILGLALPYPQLVPFLLNNGIDLQLFLTQLFANRISSMFGIDLIISS